MKKSRYNIFLEISQDKTLVFNGMSKKILYAIIRKYL